MISTTTAFDEAFVRKAFDSAVHLLPGQGALSAFVHHNTLHAFEHLSFFQALQTASRVYSADCLLSEQEFRAELFQEGVTWDEVDLVLLENLGEQADLLIAALGTRFQMRSTMLRHQIHAAASHELRWLIQESSSAHRFRPDIDPANRQHLLAGTRRRFVHDHQPIRPVALSADHSLKSMLQEFPIEKRQSWNDSEWETFTLRLLWLACLEGVGSYSSVVNPTPRCVRMRDALTDVGCEDIDSAVNECLLRFTASFVDQGYAQWSLPSQDVGFFQAFFEIHSVGRIPPHPLLLGLRHELQRIKRAGFTAWQSICESLELLQLTPTEIEAFFEATLLVLPGWGGMLHQIETRSDRVAVGVPTGSLCEFLAIRLILERVAGVRALAESGRDQSLVDLLREGRRVVPQPRAVEQNLAFSLYQVAQLRGWLPEALLVLSPPAWRLLIEEIKAFDSFQRCCVFQLVLESTFRRRLLNSLIDLETQRPISRNDHVPQRPKFQFISCIDDREESLRRYLEEVEPICETFGYAGFFAVPMYFKGIGDAHYTPLCPIAIRPQHHVQEVAHSADFTQLQLKQRRRQALAANAHWLHNHSRSFLGGLVLAFLGVLSTLPLVMRVLFPYATGSLRRRTRSLLAFSAATRLTLLRTNANELPESERLGFKETEMVDAVERLLRDIGITKSLARLIVVCGHGSASLNNPHESAYNCGACGGGHGGPNARVFCQMANTPTVREKLRERGIQIPADTHFLGMFHNTCNDEFQAFDLEQVPSSHEKDLQDVWSALESARRSNARERCRRFVSAPTWLNREAALRHVEERAEDLSQTRPEYNHATNAACVVGRRARTRGLFLDRRVFLVSYDPTQDDATQHLLQRILAAVVPVCAGINLEYYFSKVDTARFGCGSKLPHNVTSLLGVMDGSASDLRTGLSEQMVEIHQPLRLLLVVETTPEVLAKVIAANPQLQRLCHNGWIQVATLSPDDRVVHVMQEYQFVRFREQTGNTPHAVNSVDWFHGFRNHLDPAIID